MPDVSVLIEAVEAFNGHTFCFKTRDKAESFEDGLDRNVEVVAIASGGHFPWEARLAFASDVHPSQCLVHHIAHLPMAIIEIHRSEGTDSRTQKGSLLILAYSISLVCI